MSGDTTGKPQSGDVGLDRGDELTNEVTLEGLGATSPAICELLDVVTKETWEDALRQLGGAPSNPLPLWMMLASRILRAVADGERDPERIKRVALDGLRLNGSS